MGFEATVVASSFHERVEKQAATWVGAELDIHHDMQPSELMAPGLFQAVQVRVHVPNISYTSDLSPLHAKERRRLLNITINGISSILYMCGLKGGCVHETEVQ